MMLAGIFMIGMCVASYRISGFGVDAFSCMNLGVRGFLGMTFGTWQLIVNGVLLVVVWFTVRSCIRLGTIVNMVCVGYTADFLCGLMIDQAGLTVTLPLQVFFFLVGTLFASMGCACYMAAEMGIAPYDSVALIIEKGTNGKIKFQYARVLSDITEVIVGVAFCLLSGGDLRLIIGIGTVCNALFNGPLIQFFKVHAAEPLLKK